MCKSISNKAIYYTQKLPKCPSKQMCFKLFFLKEATESMACRGGGKVFHIIGAGD